MAGQNVSEMTYFVSGGTQNLNLVNQWKDAFLFIQDILSSFKRSFKISYETNWLSGMNVVHGCCLCVNVLCGWKFDVLSEFVAV